MKPKIRCENSGSSGSCTDYPQVKYTLLGITFLSYRKNDDGSFCFTNHENATAKNFNPWRDYQYDVTTIECGVNQYFIDDSSVVGWILKKIFGRWGQSRLNEEIKKSWRIKVK